MQAKDSNKPYSLKYSLKTKEDYQTIKQTLLDYKCYHKTPENSRIMASCNPVIPVMDWNEDAELQKRYVEWREEVELELGSTFSGKISFSEV